MNLFVKSQKEQSDNEIFLSLQSSLFRYRIRILVSKVTTKVRDLFLIKNVLSSV